MPQILPDVMDSGLGGPMEAIAGAMMVVRGGNGAVLVPRCLPEAAVRLPALSKTLVPAAPAAAKDFA